MKSDQDLYKQLRDLPKEQLWNVEVARFQAASSRERMERVAVIRAVGMVFSRFATDEEKVPVREWLISLLKDPQEKIRRYAMAALPKIGGGEDAESEMLTLLKESNKAREKRHLGRALEKVGGSATLAMLSQGAQLPRLTEQKVKAALSRKEDRGHVRMEAIFSPDPGLHLSLRCRRGLEGFVKAEVEELLLPKGMFRLAAFRPGCVTLIPTKPFSLSQLYQLRCFATVGFTLGKVRDSSGPEWVESLAQCIGSSHARNLMLAATEGTPRYRLDFPARGHQRGAIRQVIERAYMLSPEILNDARQAPWSVDVIPNTLIKSGGSEASVELRPRLYPDPRLFYRQDDVAAASHPPLAACMARLAGVEKDEVVWDPFCGSGLELIERALRGGVKILHGTDLDSAAILVAQANFMAAKLSSTHAVFTCSDFRQASSSATIAPGSVSLIITNPPLGRRVRIKDMKGLFADFYAAASVALRPGGRLVFVNPLRTSPTDRSLKLEYQAPVDLGGFTCRLEMYRKSRRP